MNYVTLVFKVGDRESSSFKKVREMAGGTDCSGWSMNDELGRLSLIQNAFDNKDLEKIGKYLDMHDDELNAEVSRVFK